MMIRNNTPLNPTPGPAVPAKPMGKVESVIRDSVDILAGTTGAGLGAVVHAPMGSIEGLCRGVGSTEEGSYPLLHTASTVVLGMAAGAAIGGPGGAIVGGIGGVLESGVVLIAANPEQQWTRAVDAAVDEQLQKPHTGSPIKVNVQKAIEGTLIGTAAGAREGARVGRDIGQGLGQGLVDIGKGVYHAAQGVAEGLWQVITDR